MDISFPQYHSMYISYAFLSSYHLDIKKYSTSTTFLSAILSCLTS